MWIREGFVAFLGLAAGLVVSGSFIAVITMLGVIPRFAGMTKTFKHVILYENVVILGVTLGNIISLYKIEVPLGQIGLGIAGLFAGAYIGSLAVALAEVINTIPIFSRRLKIRKGLPYLVYALALGKGVGTFIQYFIIK